MEYIVNTPCGKIKGIKVKENIIAYKGIRYAKANRFEYPTIVSKWDGVYDATEYGNCSYQPRSFYNEEENLKKVFYYNEFRKNEKYTYSEDCLFLNIFTPLNISIDDNLPVIIYIHGGGFTGGCGHEKHFDVPAWPNHNVIGVTINYRLGPLGFACLEEQHDIEGKTGNFGLYDQLTAIKWIKKNIKSFGGNPNNITIMGQSAGAMSVQQLCLSPVTKGLFNKAVMSSGGGVSKLLSIPNPSKYYKLWNLVMELTNSHSLDELKKVPVENLFSAFNKAKKEVKIMGMPVSVVVDDELVIGEDVKRFKSNKFYQIPYLVGSNSEDIIPPIIHKMGYKWVKKQQHDSYCYMFNHQLPGDNKGSWHSSDLWYWFGTLDNCWRPLTEIDYNLSNKMVTYLTNFAKTGNPNDDILLKWEPCTNKKKVLHFNKNIELKRVKKSKLWINLFTKKAVGE
jgi:para-nitrobenzyl esterase